MKESIWKQISSSSLFFSRFLSFSLSPFIKFARVNGSRYQASGTERRHLDNGNVGRPSRSNFSARPDRLCSVGGSSKWPLAGFSQSVVAARRRLCFRKSSFSRWKILSLSLSLSVLWREKELRIEDRKEKEKNEGEEEARERERGSSLMLYRAVRPTGFGPLSRFWNPSIDPLARDIRFLLASISSFCSRYDGYET